MTFNKYKLIQILIELKFKLISIFTSSFNKSKLFLLISTKIIFTYTKQINL